MTREKDRPRTGTERTLPLVVLGEIVIMPHMTVPLQVGQGKSYRAMEQAMEDDQHVLLIFVSEAEIEAYKGHEPQQLPKVGVVARLEDFSQLPDGTVKIVLEGITRAEIVDCVQSDPFYRVACRYLPDQEPKGIEVDALMDTVKQQITEFVDYLGEIPQEAVAFVHRITTPGHLADLVTYGPAFSFQDRLELLNEMEPLARLNRVQVSIRAVAAPRQNSIRHQRSARSRPKRVFLTRTNAGDSP